MTSFVLPYEDPEVRRKQYEKQIEAKRDKRGKKLTRTKLNFRIGYVMFADDRESYENGNGEWLELFSETPLTRAARYGRELKSRMSDGRELSEEELALRSGFMLCSRDYTEKWRKETAELEKKAVEKNHKEATALISFFHSDYNQSFGMMNAYYYENKLRNIASI